MAFAALDAFASCNQKELLKLRSDGTRLLDGLFDLLLTAGLAQPTPGSDLRHKLSCVFDVAWSSCLGCWIVDYVAEVCGDPYLTSTSPSEALLLDGSFVRDWATSRCQATASSLAAALRSEAQFRLFMEGRLAGERAKASTLEAVLQALGELQGLAEGQASRAGWEADLQAAQLLQQALGLAAWCGRHQLHSLGARGRYASLPEWSGAVAARRKRRPRMPLFLDDCLQALDLTGCYPFPSLAACLLALGCTCRDASSAAWQHKLALLVYYLADLGLLEGGGRAGHDLLTDLGACFHIPASTLATWHAAFLLDACTSPYTTPGHQPPPPAHASSPSLPPHTPQPSTPTDASLDAAALLLVTHAHCQPRLPTKCMEVLVGLGRPEVALALHRGYAGSRGAEGGAGVDQEELVGGVPRMLVELRLRCNLLAEALHLARSFIAACPDSPPLSPPSPSHSHSHTSRCDMQRELLHAIADWSAAAQRSAQMQSVSCGSEGKLPPAAALLLEMCFSEEEESCLVEWLAAQLDPSRPSPTPSSSGAWPPPLTHLLPLMAVTRGRVPEALAAFKRWADACAGAAAAAPPGQQDSNAGLAPVVDAVINGQEPAMPLPLRNLVLDGGVMSPDIDSLPPGLAGLTRGLTLTSSSSAAEVVQASWVKGPSQKWVPPPFVTSRIAPLGKHSTDDLSVQPRQQRGEVHNSQQTIMAPQSHVNALPAPPPGDSWAMFSAMPAAGLESNGTVYAPARSLFALDGAQEQLPRSQGVPKTANKVMKRPRVGGWM
ncbi:hypothetical protein QJQ45_029122 [Haematococcus lacustris]|nr:hypothetical protein QJQ45_029122 [Haematococcus lacustris]